MKAAGPLTLFFFFCKVPGSGEWWIRHTDCAGRYRREKAGTKGSAISLYQKRKTDALIGKKLPEKLRRRQVLVNELCDDTSAYIHKRYAKPKHDLGRLEVIRGWFGAHPADSLTTQQIESALERAKEATNWSASSWNHHHALLSDSCWQSREKSRKWRSTDARR